mmetsp:Transcript_399/g.766  ORF Transcript_399/g.766 Transcript_399/m.766 type:complete len:519 (-) Transcript_399:164-1720(-)
MSAGDPSPKVARAPKVKVQPAVYIFAGCAALNSVNLGYDVGINAAIGPPLQDDPALALSDEQLEIFIGSLDFFAIFGALFASAISDKIGRRRAFAVAAVGFDIGIVILVFSNSYGLLMLGRFFLGLGVGFGMAVDPMYIAEISPAHCRGRLVTWSELGINIGIVLGYLAGYCLADLPTGVDWRCMLALGGIMPVVMCFLVKFMMPESPRWLVLKNRLDEAADVLGQISPPGSNTAEIVDEVRVSLAEEACANAKVRWRDLFCPTPAVKHMLLVGVGVATSQQLCGIDAIQYYLPFTLKNAGVAKRTEQYAIMVMIGMLKLACIPVAGRLFDRKGLGRRPLLIASCLAMSASLFGLSVKSFATEGAAWLTITLLFAYMGFFSMGLGPGAWLVPSEVFATSIRAKAVSIATCSNRIAATLLASTVLSLAHALSWGGYFLLLGMICLVIALGMCRGLPETKGMTLEEMTRYFRELSNDKTGLLDSVALQPPTAPVQEVELSTKVVSKLGCPPEKIGNGHQV